MNNYEHIPQDTLERIERFLNNEMTGEERDIFSKALAADEQLQQQVDDVRLMMLGIQEQSLQEKLAGFHEGLEAGAPVVNIAARKTLFIKKWMAAAGAIVLLGTAYLIFRTGNNTNEKLFAKYYTADPGMITAMSTTDNYDFERAMVDYKTGDYASALAAWEKMLQAEPANDTLVYFAGAASIQLKKEKEAKDYFSRIVKDKSSAFYKDACWYLGLVYLKYNNPDSAGYWIERSDHSDKDELLLRLQKHAGE